MHIILYTHTHDIYLYTKRSRYAQVCASWDNKGSMNKNWEILFKRIDADFSGRTDYPEIVRAEREERRAWSMAHGMRQCTSVRWPKISAFAFEPWVD